MADGGYQGNADVIMPHHKPHDGNVPTDWQEDLNTQHRKVHAHVEHCLARMKNWKILRDYRRAARTLHDIALGIANLHNLALAG
ncbi:DDE superfamily endonuclease [Actinosynnema pretiosum]|nr:DDE superfamily endonuclease [Actinosynnema pretiosum]